MIKSLRIQNFKSIVDDTIELGKINVFIGENGCGKSNILEAMAMMSASFEGTLNVEGLYSKGIRVAKPGLMRNSFTGQRKKAPIQINCNVEVADNRYPISSNIQSQEDTSVFAEWDSDISSPLIEEEKNLRFFIDYVKSHSLPKEERSEINNGKLESIIQAMLKIRPVKDIQFINDFLIYNLSTKALRGIYSESKKQPLGVNGENLDILISSFDYSERSLLKDSLVCAHIIWFSDIVIDSDDVLKFEGHKLGKSTSTLYFKDRFMKRSNNIFSAENANEGILHILFYLALFISKRTPKFFAIDNIETALNPQLCRNLLKTLAELAKGNDKQALITTHNPAVLDGLNLHDEDQRLFVVYRNDKGHTQTKRISVKPDFDHNRYKLSELWMRGQLGGIPQTF